MLAAARAELASGDSGAGPNGASTKPPKKRVRNFTADDRAAHRIFEKKRRELFRERLNVRSSLNLYQGLSDALL
jgi:hypothetical protein